MTTNDGPRLPEEIDTNPSTGDAEAHPHDPGHSPAIHPIVRARPWWLIPLMISPAILATLALGLQALLTDILKIKTDLFAAAIIGGFAGAFLVAIAGGIWIAIPRPNPLAKVLVGFGVFVGIFLLNAILMFGGCLVGVNYLSLH